jgi:hemerythrin superfamily protein
MSAQLQPSEGQREPTDAIALIEDDHRKVDDLFDRYERLGREGDLAERGRVVGSIVDELRLHAAIEEQVLYPAIEEALPDDGPELVEGSLREHAEAKQTLDGIEMLGTSSDDLHDRVTSLIEEVRHHVEEEETDILPRLREALDSEQLMALGEELRGAKMTLLGVVEHGGVREEPPAGPPQRTSAEEGLVTGDAEPMPRPPTRRAKTTAQRPATKQRRPARKAAPKTARAKPTSKSSARRKTTAAPPSRTRARPVYRVKPTPTGRWVVARKGAARASATFDTKSDAVARGKELAKRGGSGQLVVHGRDGRIQNEFTYGDGPRRARG